MYDDSYKNNTNDDDFPHTMAPTLHHSKCKYIYNIYIFMYDISYKGFMI
jgi:hypothetical protein